MCNSFSLLLGGKIWCSVLTSDGETQFTSSIWTGVCRFLGISLSTTYSFHPPSNCIIECFHRSLKTALCACLAGSDWFLHLPLVLLGLRSVPNGFLSLRLSLVLPSQYLVSSCRVLSFRLPRSCRKFTGCLWICRFSPHHVPPPHHIALAQPVPLSPALLMAQFVFVREDALVLPLSQLYHGPYLVLEQWMKFFHLQLGDQADVVSVSRLKSAFSDGPFSSSLPPALNMVLFPHQPPPLPSA